MNNLKSYNDFLNEGVFGKIFGSKYNDIYKKLYNYILNVNINNVTFQPDSFTDTYTIIYKSGEKRDEDPYGEEIWEDDVEIKLKSIFNFEMGNDYYLYINDEFIPVRDWEARKLYKTVNKRFNNREDEERKKRVNVTLNKLR